MKKYVMLAVATLMMVSLTMAQQPGHNRGQRGDGNGPGHEGIKKERKMEMNPQAMVDRLAKQVELTDVQKADLLKHFQQQVLKREAMRQEFRKLQEKAKADQQGAQGEVEKILGPEKFKKLQADRIEHLQRMNKKLMIKKHRMNKAPEKKPCN